MAKISVALIAMGIIMAVFMSDVTAAVLCIVFGISIPMYRALVFWAYKNRHRKDRVQFVNFIQMMTSEE